MMKPQDIVIAVSLLELQKPTEAVLATFVSISQSQVHSALKRLDRAHLVKERIVNRQGLKEFLFHGIRYVFPGRYLEPAIGLPTSWALLPDVSVGGMKPIWPDPEGIERGIAIEPLHYSVLVVAKQNKALYEMLAFIEVIRVEGSRLRNIAKLEFERKLND